MNVVSNGFSNDENDYQAKGTEQPDDVFAGRG
jgi:hypothetical protein